MQTRKSNALQPDDLIVTHDTVVLIMRPGEDITDRFGRPTVSYWCRDLATGREGWMTYGPAVVDVELAVCPRCGRPLGYWPLDRGGRCAPANWQTCIREVPLADVLTYAVRQRTVA